MEISLDQLDRLVKVAESIAKSLEKIANPPVKTYDTLQNKPWEISDLYRKDGVQDTVPTKNPQDVTQSQFDDAIEGLRKEQR